ncbi:MAG: DUF3375 domain-containing protein [Gammaproteobacteria bacterium]
MSLCFHDLSQLSKTHPAWRLLQAEHAPLIISFLDQVFIEPNIRVMSQADLVSRLEDVLFQLRDEAGDEGLFPRSAKGYLDDWAQPEKGWLSKFYPAGSDEAHFDLMPATEKAVSWVEGLAEKSFIGTESRLLTIFDLLRQMVSGVETDKVVRIEELQRKREEIDRQIADIEAGDIPVMDATALKDRFFQFSATARELLGDFRAVEQNFRLLDRQMREDIAIWEGSKGELLDHVFGDRDAIADSDQGKSFRAFWDFLMSPGSQQELTDLLEQVFSIEALTGLTQDQRLKLVHYDWLEAGDHTQRMVARLSRQLRRYLDDQAWLENKRIMQLIDSISQQAIKVRSAPPQAASMAMDRSSAEITLPMARPLFSPPAKTVLASVIKTASGEDIDTDALFNQIVVDKAALESHINQQLQTHNQITLKQLVEQYPLQQGLAELVAYLALAGNQATTVFDEQTQTEIQWTDNAGVVRKATLPRIIFNRSKISAVHNK